MDLWDQTLVKRSNLSLTSFVTKGKSPGFLLPGKGSETPNKRVPYQPRPSFGADKKGTFII